jgi:hypothetical protein
MNKLVLSCLLFALPGTPLCGQTPPAKAPTAAKSYRHEICTAVVEKVFRVEDDGFVSNAYQVTWRGKPVIVADTIHSTDAVEGETIRFMVFWNDMTEQKIGMKLLHFSIL